MTAPTGRKKILYYILGLTPSVEHAEWVRNDVASDQWLVRRAVQVFAGLMLGMLIGATIFGYRPGLIVGAILGSVIGSLIMVVFKPDFLRRRTLVYYEKRWEKQRSG